MARTKISERIEREARAAEASRAVEGAVVAPADLGGEALCLPALQAEAGWAVSAPDHLSMIPSSDSLVSSVHGTQQLQAQSEGGNPAPEDGGGGAGAAGAGVAGGGRVQASDIILPDGSRRGCLRVRAREEEGGEGAGDAGCHLIHSSPSIVHLAHPFQPIHFEPIPAICLTPTLFNREVPSDLQPEPCTPCSRRPLEGRGGKTRRVGFSDAIEEHVVPLELRRNEDVTLDVRLPCPSSHPGGNPGANLKSTSLRCYLFEVAFVWKLTNETIVLPLGCLQGSQPCPSSLVLMLYDVDEREG